MSARKTPTRSKAQAAARTATVENPAPLLTELRLLIDEARRPVAMVVNASLTLMYWRIGTEVLVGRRAGYGEEIVATLSRQWVADHGRGFEENLRRRCRLPVSSPGEEAT